MDSVQIRNLPSRSQEESRTVPPGKVNQICKEWVVREDGGIAHRLQSEEIEQHYDHNRTRNRLVRTDLAQAKTLQRTEEEEAEFLRRACETFALEQEEEDAKVAKLVETQLQLEEKRREEEDERLARQLQERERQRLERRRREKELREVERVAQIVSDPNLQHCASVPKTVSDFSDLYQEPPEGLSEEELRKFREDQDAEFARLLQEQETKRRGNQVTKDDTLLAIEAQDHELAKLLQEQEKARARRARERARLKSASLPLVESSVDPPDTLPHSSSPIQQDEEVTLTKRPLPSPPPPSVENIAAAIDPTYNRRMHQMAHPASPPIHTESLSLNGSSSLYFDDEPALPYMPIQGQRRSSTLDKGKKSKRNKEGCKNQ